MNPFKMARDYVAKGETSEECAIRSDQVIFVSGTALVVVLLVIGSIAIGGREFVTPWILMFALAGVAGCALRRFLTMSRAIRPFDLESDDVWPPSCPLSSLMVSLVCMWIVIMIVVSGFGSPLVVTVFGVALALAFVPLWVWLDNLVLL